MIPQKTLETTDLFKSAFLLCMGGSLANISVEFNGRKTATFLITGNNLDQYNTDYVSGRAMVNPTQLKNSLNHLRDVLFNTLREKENRDYGNHAKGNYAKGKYDRTRDNRYNKNRH